MIIELFHLIPYFRKKPVKYCKILSTENYFLNPAINQPGPYYLGIIINSCVISS